ncbi:MAG: hypothetical protein IJS03_09290 [Eubacterium sp.]|nr:hypothetical protein [Eubacterium sp.]
MSNEQEILKTQKDIAERERISNKFKLKGYFSKEEKDEAIEKVLDLRYSDMNVMAIAVADNINGYTTPEAATDDMVFNEINKQIEFLKAKLVNEIEENQ